MKKIIRLMTLCITISMCVVNGMEVDIDASSDSDSTTGLTVEFNHEDDSPISDSEIGYLPSSPAEGKIAATLNGLGWLDMAKLSGKQLFALKVCSEKYDLETIKQAIESLEKIYGFHLPHPPLLTFVGRWGKEKLGEVFELYSHPFFQNLEISNGLAVCEKVFSFYCVDKGRSIDVLSVMNGLNLKGAGAARDYYSIFTLLYHLNKNLMTNLPDILEPLKIYTFHIAALKEFLEAFFSFDIRNKDDAVNVVSNIQLFTDYDRFPVDAAVLARALWLFSSCEEAQKYAMGVHKSLKNKWAPRDLSLEPVAKILQFMAIDTKSSRQLLLNVFDTLPFMVFKVEDIEDYINLLTIVRAMPEDVRMKMVELMRPYLFSVPSLKAFIGIIKSLRLESVKNLERRRNLIRSIRRLNKDASKYPVATMLKSSIKQLVRMHERLQEAHTHNTIKRSAQEIFSNKRQRVR